MRQDRQSFASAPAEAERSPVSTCRTAGGRAPMPSLRASILRCVLRIHRAAFDWDMPIATLRATQEWSDWLIGPPRRTEITAVLSADVTAEWIVPGGVVSRAVVLYVHGGGWTLRLHNLERRMLARMCRTATVPALAVDYRLAPEHPFPAALEDCISAYRWLLKNGTRPQDIVVVGFSSGGNLALATLMSLRDDGDPLPAAAVCISTVSDLAGISESFRTAKDPAVTADLALSMVRHYAGAHDLHSPLLSPIHGDLRGLPQTLIHVGGDELVLSDATRLRDQLHQAGVPVCLAVWPNMWHAWHLNQPYLPEAREAVNEIGAFVRERLNSKLTRP